MNQFLYDANGNVTSSSDALSRTTSRTYDSFNRIKRVTFPPPFAGQPNPILQIDANNRGDVTRFTDPRNLQVVYTITGLGEVTSQASPDTGSTTRTYDPAGNLKTSKDARGFTTTYTYDAINRVTQATYGDGTASLFFYDGGVNSVGRLSRVVDPGPVTTVWTYDARGHVATKAQSIGSGTSALTHTLAYAFNSTTGQLSSITFPSGRVVALSYNGSTKDLERITVDGTPVASGISWNPYGDIRQMTLGNGQVWTTTLDQDGRITSYALGGATYGVIWDAGSRVASANNGVDASQNQSFVYDNLDRLTSFTSAGRSQTFAYDPSGNLTSKTDLSGSSQSNYTFNIDSASNRMSSISNIGITYGFDAAGNRTSGNNINHLYNARGRLYRTNLVNGATTQSINYLLNALNQRVRKTGPSGLVPQGTQIFLYDEGGKLIGEYDSLGRARTEHVWAGPRPVAVISYTYVSTSLTPATTTILYVETDHLGTPRRISNAAGQLRWTWVSAPFGDTMPSENPAGLGAFTYSLRFAGQYFDKETNLHYNWHRYYEPTTGRYVQSDPVGLLGGINTYAYVRATPLVLTDPLGLWSTKAHNYFIDEFVRRCLPGMAAQYWLVDAIKAGSAYADSASFQTGEYSYMHAMSSKKHNKQGARAMMETYIDGYMNAFEGLRSSSEWREIQQGYFSLGMALHPLMDSTSPVHKDFQAWEFIDAWQHGSSPLSGESIDVAPQYLGETLRLMQGALERYSQANCSCVR